MNFSDFFHFNQPDEIEVEAYDDELVLLSEGGLAGHLSHPFDDRELTFDELKTMMSEVFSGNVELSEKTDGQNISITFKNGKIGLARNKATFINPMSIEETASKFDGRGEIKNAFVNSLKAISSALSKVSKDQLEEWFQNGKNFISAEVIYPPTKNVIDYGNRCLVMIHNLTEYDENGNKVAEYPELGQEIYNTLNDAGATNQDNFEIVGPQIVLINDAIAAELNIRDFNKSINKLLSKNKLSGSNTIQDYIEANWSKIIIKEFDLEGDEEVYTHLLNRFANYDKSFKKPDLIKLAEKEGLNKSKFIAAFNKLDKEQADIYSDIMDPLETIVLQTGANFLQTLTGFIAANPDETISSLAKELNSTIENIESGDAGEVSDKLIKKIELLNKIGLDKLVPTEGVVFKYKGKVYKLTGAFAPINQILGWFKFDRS